MQKVYCKNCEYNKTFAFEYTNKCRLTNEYTGLEETKSTDKSERNNNGECQHYKKKWWIFWIK